MRFRKPWYRCQGEGSDGPQHDHRTHLFFWLLYLLWQRRTGVLFIPQHFGKSIASIVRVTMISGLSLVRMAIVDTRKILASTRYGGTDQTFGSISGRLIRPKEYC